MSNIYEWSTEAASNSNIDNAIKWELGQLAKLTNDSARAMMQRFAEYLLDLAPRLSVAGGAKIYNIKTCSQINQLREAMRFYLIPHANSLGEDSLAINGKAQLFIYKFNALQKMLTRLEPNDLTSGNCYELLYSSRLLVDGNNICGWFVTNLHLELAGVSALSGTILAYGAIAAPPGWALCDGTMLKRAKYPQLYQVIGQSFGGKGDNFALPDLRGAFIRGFDAGRGLDIGRAFGSFQDEESKKHEHEASLLEEGDHTHRRLMAISDDDQVAQHKNYPALTLATASEAYAGPSEIAVDGKHKHKITVTPEQGHSMRPKNVSITYIIKT